MASGAVADSYWAGYQLLLAVTVVSVVTRPLLVATEAVTGGLWCSG